MLSRENRLCASEDFRRVFRRGVMSRHPLGRLHVSLEGTEKRFAVVTSRRVGRATRRNHARRIFAEAIRSIMDIVKPGTAGVLVLRPEAADASFAEARECVQHLLNACGAVDAD